MELQVEVSDKVLDLKKFQENLNSHCAKIHRKIDYADLTGPSVSQEPTTVQPNTGFPAKREEPAVVHYGIGLHHR